MPTLKERIETLEAALRDQRDPLTQAAKDDHTPSKRILELESQHADLAKAVAELSNHVAGLDLNDQTLVNDGADYDKRITALENARANPPIITGVQPNAS